MTVPRGEYLFLDSCVVLGIRRGRITPVGDTACRMVITPTVSRETNEGTGNVHTHEYDRILGRGRLYGHYLGEMKRMHGSAADDPAGVRAQTWMRQKWMTLWLHGIRTGDIWRGDAVIRGAADRALGILNGGAKNDRKIVAEAASIADPGATIVSCDADILLFHREIGEMTGGRLRVLSPDCRFFSLRQTAIRAKMCQGMVSMRRSIRRQRLQSRRVGLEGSPRHTDGIR